MKFSITQIDLIHSVSGGLFVAVVHLLLNLDFVYTHIFFSSSDWMTLISFTILNFPSMALRINSLFYLVFNALFYGIICGIIIYTIKKLVVRSKR